MSSYRTPSDSVSRELARQSSWRNRSPDLPRSAMFVGPYCWDTVCGTPSRKSAKSAPEPAGAWPPYEYKPVNPNAPFGVALVRLVERSMRQSPPARNRCVFHGCTQEYDTVVRLSLRCDGDRSRMLTKFENCRLGTP